MVEGMLCTSSGATALISTHIRPLETGPEMSMATERTPRYALSTLNSLLPAAQVALNWLSSGLWPSSFSALITVFPSLNLNHPPRMHHATTPLNSSSIKRRLRHASLATLFYAQPSTQPALASATTIQYSYCLVL